MDGNWLVRFFTDGWPLVLAAPGPALELFAAGLLLGGLGMWLFNRREVRAAGREVAAADKWRETEASQLHETRGKLATALQQLAVTAAEAKTLRERLVAFQQHPLAGLPRSILVGATGPMLENVDRITMTNAATTSTVSALNLSVGGSNSQVYLQALPSDRLPKSRP